MKLRLIGLVLSCGILFPALAQQLLPRLPGYARYKSMLQERDGAVKPGALSVIWKDEGKACEYQRDGMRYRFDLVTRHESLAPADVLTNRAAGGPAARRPSRRTAAGAPARGRQFASAVSPDEKWEAFYRERNLWLRGLEGAATNEWAVTTEGSAATRVKLGTATWTYGEELNQNTAMWWSADSGKIAFYRFDESQVPDYFLTLEHARIQNRLDVEPYPKAGGTNPVVDLLVYDLASRKTTRIDVRSGRPFRNDTVGHYVYRVSWQGNELLFHRTDRLQKVLELCAADPGSGQCRVVVREEWRPSWTENSPAFRFLKDGRRFIWSSERSGWKNFYLYSLHEGLLAQLTDHRFEVADLVAVDEAQAALYYTARSGDNRMKLQLHRVTLDGKHDQRLTDPRYHHRVSIAPDFRHFTDVAQTHSQAPITRLCDSNGTAIATLAFSDLSKFKRLGLRPAESFEFKAADGATPLFGLLHFPSDFKPKKKYPLLIDVYAGPESNGAGEEFATPSLLTELGFLYARLDSRSASGRGKRALDAIYQQLGIVEIDDQAAGVKALRRRPYVDGSRVGIFGTSYGGTASLLCLLRYPEVFHAACASSSVTDFRNYDTIYTERYFGLPQDDRNAYDQVCAMNYVPNLIGKLMLFYGTADDNVHPSNTLQLIKALQAGQKSFEVQVGADQGHAGLGRERMMEFFITSLR